MVLHHLSAPLAVPSASHCCTLVVQPPSAPASPPVHPRAPQTHPPCPTDAAQRPPGPPVTLELGGDLPWTPPSYPTDGPQRSAGHPQSPCLLWQPSASPFGAGQGFSEPPAPLLPGCQPPVPCGPCSGPRHAPRRSGCPSHSPRTQTDSPPPQADTLPSRSTRCHTRTF